MPLPVADVINPACLEWCPAHIEDQSNRCPVRRRTEDVTDNMEVDRYSPCNPWLGLMAPRLILPSNIAPLFGFFQRYSR